MREEVAPTPPLLTEALIKTLLLQYRLPQTYLLSPFRGAHPQENPRIFARCAAACTRRLTSSARGVAEAASHKTPLGVQHPP